jgi:hypothetical protein
MWRWALTPFMAVAAAAENSVNSCPGWDWLHEITRRVDWELLGIRMKASGAIHLSLG